MKELQESKQICVLPTFEIDDNLKIDKNQNVVQSNPHTPQNAEKPSKMQKNQAKCNTMYSTIKSQPTKIKLPDEISKKINSHLFSKQAETKKSDSFHIGG